MTENPRYVLRLSLPEGVKHTHYPFVVMGSYSLSWARAITMRALYDNETTLRPSIREAVRQRMIRFLLSEEQSAAVVGDGPCLEFCSERFPADFYANVLNYRDWDGYGDAERVAIEFAERTVLDPANLNGDDAFWQRLRGSLSEAEIVDLAVMVTTWDSHTRLYQVLGLVNNSSIPLGYDGSREAPLDSREGAVGTETAVQLRRIEARPDRRKTCHDVVNL